MNYSQKAGLMGTQQTRYSEDIFNSGIKTIRKRINVLSQSSVFTPSKLYPTQISNPNSSNSTGMLAKISKMTFDGEMLLQDVRTQNYEVRKTKQYLTIVAKQITRNNQKVESHLISKLQLLQQQMTENAEKSTDKRKSMIFEIQKKRQKSDLLKEELNELSRRVKSIEDALGLYTAFQKLQRI